MVVKVLHTGDLHLGIGHRSRNYPEALRSQLVEARMKTLETLVETANREGCQLFVVTGDLFDRITVGKETVLKAVTALARFEGCVAVLPGNHDYYDEFSSLWKTFREQAPEHVLLLSAESPYPLHDFGLDLVLYPAPCDKKHSAEHRLGWIAALQEKPAAMWHLGLAHGTVRGLSPDLADQYFPMGQDELLALGLDHWFLGHTHIRIPDVATVRDCKFSYSGTPEPDGFDCGHGGWAWITQLADGYTESKALATGTYRFREVSWFVRSLDELREQAQVLGQEERLLVKLSLQGVLPRKEYEERIDCLRELEQKLTYLEWDDTELRMEISKESIAEEFAAGSFPYLFLTELAEGDDNDALQVAYELIKKVKK